MQQLIEKHSVGLLFGTLALVIAGYIDIRTIAGNMSENLNKVVHLAEVTREEQLLRTDEIDYVNQLRGAGTLDHIRDDRGLHK